VASDNEQFVREWADALNRGDFEALIKGAPPEFEWVVAREHPDATTHRGPGAVSSYLAEWRRMMPDFRVQIVELEEQGDRVLTVIEITGTGVGSGARTEVRTATISTFREGVPVRTEEFLDPEEARAALAAG
jgi:ketosteroid isomerase-like protein